MLAVNDVNLRQLELANKLYRNALTETLVGLSIHDRDRVDQLIAWMQGAGAFVEWIKGTRQMINQFYEEEAEKARLKTARDREGCRYEQQGDAVY